MAFRQGHLLYFVTVAEEGQFTRAARRLHVAQPAISQAIAQLESELGLQLLERHPRGVTLTPAGSAFYEKARVAVAAAAEAALTAQSLARADEGTIEFGFLGVPPGLDSPAALETFARQFPAIDVRYRELPFPSLPTATWIAEVDVAACHAPPADPDVWSELVRVEPRVVLAPVRNSLAAMDELTLEDVLEETFIGLHPSVAPAWASFWSLDDHRGGPPRRVTVDRAFNPQEVIAALSMRDAITTVPSSAARVIAGPVAGIRAIPLLDAEPARMTLVGHETRRNPLVATMLEFARSLRPAQAP